ncbi:MAG: NAD-dependent deacetylase, partial [Desulfobacterales bacterium]|nr:NAD-dependent deacetylase [Desulfobacterales bacterium]
GQFHKAGFDAERIEECHGSIHHLQCIQPCTDQIWTEEGLIVNVDEIKFEAENPLPGCKNCCNLSRPNVLMFGDSNWISQRTDEQSLNLQKWLQKIKTEKGNLVIIELGAGLSVPTVRRTSESILKSIKGILIRINPIDYKVPSGNISIPFGALEGIKKILNKLYDF